MGIKNMSIHEIQQQLEELEHNQADLRQELNERMQQAKLDFVRELKDTIHGRGYEISEIASLIAPRRRRPTSVKTGSPRQYKTYIDPANSDNTYVRGVVPGWMRQQMQDKGFDPNSKEDRDNFKKDYLRVLES